MDYKLMSDFEINLSALKILCAGQFILYHEQEVDDLLEIAGLDGRLNVVKYTAPSGTVRSFDGCNNPKDAWSIIVDNGISINKWHSTDKNWTADVEHPMTCDDFNTIEVSDENPLRAAMICFLLMKDAEQ